MIGSGLAALLGALGPGATVEDAEARNRRDRGKKRRKNGNGGGGSQPVGAACSANSHCASGLCTAGACACPSGASVVQGECCPDSRVCGSGREQICCSAGFVCMDLTCILG